MGEMFNTFDTIGTSETVEEAQTYPDLSKEQKPS